tara:strand:- start:1696 stop:2622 length:927 start_codon:yes stop_codon:yes gene_type:complete
MRLLLLFLALLAPALSSAQQDRKEKRQSRIAPTHPNIAYGTHERHCLDLWIPKQSRDGRRFPLLIYFHGGGFVGGDKQSFDPTLYLDQGIACASVNYRFVDGESTLSPAPFEDSARAVQTLRHRADEWNLDPGRLALSGSSAGGVITLWLGYHDDLAIPESEDPIARQSTRVCCLIPINGPTNLIPDWIHSHIGGSELIHPSFRKLFGSVYSPPLTNKLRSQITSISPWEYVSEDDPPTYLVYSGRFDELPLPSTATTGKVIHHPYFGKALKEKLDTMGVENDFKFGIGLKNTPVFIDFLLNQFGIID